MNIFGWETDATKIKLWKFQICGTFVRSATVLPSLVSPIRQNFSKTEFSTPVFIN